MARGIVRALKNTAMTEAQRARMVAAVGAETPITMEMEIRLRYWRNQTLGDVDHPDVRRAGPRRARKRWPDD
jgi:hypothetical protein